MTTASSAFRRAMGFGGVLLLAACSTGTVDRRLFAHTQDETYVRVRAAVPPGTTVEAAAAAMKGMGWSCYQAPRSWVIPNDTHQRIDGPTLSCDAYPSLGGYPLSKQYSAEFFVRAGQVGALQVTISDPGV